MLTVRILWKEGRGFGFKVAIKGDLDILHLSIFLFKKSRKVYKYDC